MLSDPLPKSGRDNGAVKQWIAAFFAGQPADQLFAADAIWRDYLGYVWDLKTYEGCSEISAALPANTGQQIGDIEQLSDSEGQFYLDTSHGRVKALIELDGNLCVGLFTSLQSLATAPPACAPQTAPFVLIIGAGQSGLALAAQLQHLQVPYLVIEKNARIGDNWRHRYDSLVLHDPVWVNHLPFKPFPDDWPIFTPKDQMGDWLEAYANSLSLNVRCDYTLSSASFDTAHSCWHITAQQKGKATAFTVSHLVFAVGTSGFAHSPEFDGASEFSGPQLHSSAYKSGAEFSGQKIAIIGATNSAHDIAVDLVRHGAYPTLIQRSTTHVVPHQVYIENILAPLYAPKHGRSLAQSDFLSTATPMRRLERKGQAIFAHARQEWSKFYQHLEATGFALDFAEDGSGIIGKYRRSASGYYIDVGGSKKVMDGQISVRSGVHVEAVTQHGLRLSDASHLDADAIIYATGFGSMEEWVARLINQETADRIGKCWGYGSGYRGDPGPWEGELRNMWKPTAQQGLWFMGGNLAQGRIYSHYLGLQLCQHYRKEQHHDASA